MPSAQRLSLIFERLEPRVLLFGAVAPAFQVNTYTPLDQDQSRVASDAQGNFVVVWRTSHQDMRAGDAVYGQRYRADGTRLGGELPLTPARFGAQSHPSIAMEPDGDFVLTWADIVVDGTGFNIHAQRFDAAANTIGDEIAVNTFLADEQMGGVVAVDPAGNFVVAWESRTQDGDGYGIFARRFDFNGEPLTGEISVNTRTVGDQNLPAISMNSHGEFVIAWFDHDAGGKTYLRRFNPDASPAGEPMVANDVPGFGPLVAIDDDGSIVATWASPQGVLARRWVSGAWQGNPFPVTNSVAVGLAVAVTGPDRFLLSWTDNSTNYQTFGKIFDASGSSLIASSGAFPLSDPSAKLDRLDAVASSPISGTLVAAWERTSSVDNRFFDTFARRFTSAPPAVTSFEFNWRTAPQSIKYTFNSDVSQSLQPTDLTLLNRTESATSSPGAVTFDRQTNTATFTFPQRPLGALGDGDYRATLGATGVSQPDGTRLVADDVHDFFFLNGDANRDRKVDVVDLATLATNWQQPNRDYSQGDFNYDGRVDVSDLGILATGWQKALAAVSVPGIVMARPAPTVRHRLIDEFAAPA